jgi:iron complex outermembrane receptor protein
MQFERKKIALALSLALGGGGAIVGAAPALAQDIRVEVTGSSIRRVDAETALPVTIVTREEIAQTGVNNTADLLATLPSVAALGGISLTAGAGLSIYGQSSVSLRGLGANRTLVLVNGRRLVDFAGLLTGDAVNVNAIPISAIERVEVLRDGASAVYGSDAVAGVINFILNKEFVGAEVGGQYGAPTRSGGGESWNAYIVGGWGTLAKDKFNVNASFAYSKEEALFGADRDFASVGTVLPYFVSGATGQGNIEGAYKPGTGSAANGTWQEGTIQPGWGGSPGSGYGNPLAASNQCEAINMRKNPTNTSKGAPFCNFDTAPFVGLLPESERYTANVNLTWQITDNVQLFAEGIYAHQEVIQTIQASPVRRSFNLTNSAFQDKGIDPVLLIYPSNPNYQIAANYLNAQGFGSIVGQPLGITSRVQDFGGRQSTDEADQWRAVVGLRGTAWNQDWELSYYHNESKVDGTVSAGYFSTTEYARLVQNSNDWNPWSLQQSAEFNAKLPAAAYIGPTVSATSKSDTVDGKISGEAWKLPSGPMMYAAGFNWVKQSYESNPSPAMTSGDIAGLGGAAAALDVDRDVFALYGELNIPIVKTVEATVAGRWDDYSDFGGTFNYFATVRWQPAKELVLRAAYGTGFRAPSLQDLYYPVILGSSAQFNDPVTGEQDLQVNEYTGGNANLQPEKSDQLSLGIVWQPLRQFSATVDWFRINLEDIIATPATQDVVSGNANGNPAYANAVVRDASGNIETVTSVTVNSGDATVQGFDVALQWKDTFSWGTPSIGLLGTYIQKFDQTTPGGVEQGKVGTIVTPTGDPVLDADTGGVVPRWKHALTFGYEYGPWQATVIQNYYRSYEMGNDLNGDRRYTGNQSIWDVQFAWTGYKGLRLALGVKNVLDADPPIFIPVSNQFQSGYDAAMYDPRSRFVYGSVSWKFW